MGVKSILNGMKETEKKKILSLVATSRQSAFEKGLIENVLLFAANKNKLNVPSSTNHFVEFSDEDLADIDIDDLLEEIDDDINGKKHENEMHVDTFVQILNSSEKQYDIPEILRHVSPHGATTVSFESIASYHQPLNSIN